RARASQLLNRLEHGPGPDRLARRPDRDDQTLPLGRHGAREDPELRRTSLGLGEGGLVPLGARTELVQGRLEGGDVGVEALLPVGQIGQDPDQVVLARALELGIAGVAAHLYHERKREQAEEHGDRDARRGEPPRGPEAPRARSAWLGHRHQALNRCRRMAATLPKMRTPRTTTTPVESWPPTPSWSPR